MSSLTTPAISQVPQKTGSGNKLQRHHLSGQRDLLGIIMIYPILWLFASSLKASDEIWTNVTSLIPTRFTLENYVNGWAGFGGVSFATFFLNSFFYTIIATIGAVLSSAVVAYGFARIRFFGRSFWFTCMILP